MRLTLSEFAKLARQGERLPMVTCYDYSSALIAERAGLRLILVGDSLGQVMLVTPTRLASRWTTWSRTRRRSRVARPVP